MALLRSRRSLSGALGLLSALAFLASCSDLPTRPRSTVRATGRVLDRDGAPLPGARLYFRNEEFDRPEYGYAELPPQMQGQVASGPDGRFQLDLWSGRYRVAIDGPLGGGYGDMERRGVLVGSDAAPLTFQFQGVWLRGTLIGPGGVPIEDGRVVAFPSRGQAYTGWNSYNVTERTYEMLLRPGVYDLEAAPYFTNAGIPRLVFESVPVLADTTVDLILDGTRVQGFVRGSAGEALPGVAITLSGGSAWCEARTLTDGSYTLYPPPGVYMARLYTAPPLDYIFSREAPLVVGDTPMSRDFDLSGVTWTGTVRSSETGQPVPGAAVRVDTVSYGFGEARCTADATGAFRLVVPSGGVYALSAREPSSTYQPYQLVAVAAAGADSTFDILIASFGSPAPTRPALPH